ncbi:hypothetical protein P43SY_009742 [Pythium insidiosum]|uniref:PAP-associated domain-containing protein n=1 Tax=Pythium insidiosum TaxID=114742 RepID=A0AAD5M659_PYTIN|nr:hypothetical protein P43SY_009742 [Pythium insidiosum]
MTPTREEMEVTVGAAPARKRPRRGARKSKAERLAARNVDASAASADSLLAELHALLRNEAPGDAEQTTSERWDRAQRLAWRVGSLSARRSVVSTLLFERQAPRAAVHYASRLQLSSAELLDLLVDGCRAAAAFDEGPSLLAAKFLADASDALVSSAGRLERLLLPWLAQHQAAASGAAATETSAVAMVTAVTETEPSDNSSNKRKTPSSSTALLTAVRLALSTHKHQDEKLALQRQLVRRVLSLGQHETVALQYAPAFRSRLDALATRVRVAPARDDAVAIDRELERRLALATTVETALRRLWPDARVLVFGSSATGTLLLDDDDGAAAGSRDDVDLCVLLPSCPERQQATAPIVEDIKDHLALELGVDVLAVGNARIPIARWTDPTTALQCDLCVNNVAALWNTVLVRHLVLQSPFASVARRVCVWMKRWLRSRRQRLGESLTSYGLVLLVLHYLQRDGLLPPVDAAALAATGAHDEDQGPGAVAVDAMEQRVQQLLRDGSSRGGGRASCPSLESLVVGFFRFYGAGGFDFEHGVVSLRHPTPTKQAKGWSRKTWRFSLSIEDPIETARDLGSLFSRATLARFRAALVECVVRIDAVAEADAPAETLLEALLKPERQAQTTPRNK